MSKDKRASLSSGLLGSKDAAPLSEGGASSAAGAVASDTTKTEARTHVLYSKGAASSSGFRPPHWSYEDEAKERGASGERGAEPKSTITPFPVNSPSPPAGDIAVVQRPWHGRKVTAVVASMAVLAGIAFLGIHRTGNKTSAAAAVAPSVVQTAPAASPSPKAPASASSATMPAQNIAELMARGDELFAKGDIVAARGFYERAAEGGSARASTAVGKTYDPVLLEQLGVRGTRGDAGVAAQWYRKAGAAGDPEAELHLKGLIARYAG